MTRHPVVLAITGASGAPYGVRLLEVLARNRVPVWLVATSHGFRLLKDECGIGSLDELRAATGGDWSSVTPFPDGDRGALARLGLAADQRHGDLSLLDGDRRRHRGAARVARWSSAPRTSRSRSGAG